MTHHTKQCLRCDAPTQQYLCTRCTTTTRDTLHALPRLLHHLNETALGQARLGNPTRHTKFHTTNPLHGDEELAELIEQLPDHQTDLYEARRLRQRLALRHALATGRVNERASTLHAITLNFLNTWARDLCETRGLTPELSPTTNHPARLCAWLAHHTNAIANHPAADEFCDELDQRIHETLTVINRPDPPHTILGPCPVELTDNYGSRICNHELTAPPDADTVQCGQCSTTHNVTNLREQHFRNTGEVSFTLTELTDWVLPALREHIPPRTLRHWIATAKLIPTGHDARSHPRYKIADIRALRDREPRNCTIDGCDRPHHSNGYCDTHRKARKRAKA